MNLYYIENIFMNVHLFNDLLLKKPEEDIDLYTGTGMKCMTEWHTAKSSTRRPSGACLAASDRASGDWSPRMS